MDLDLTFAFGLVITAMLISLSCLFAMSAFAARDGGAAATLFARADAVNGVSV